MKKNFLWTFLKIFCFCIGLLAYINVFAWGKQGHQIINQTAAFLLAEESPHEFLREHAFDLGYFANVPDIVWKQESTYNTESPQHFMDMEIFEKELHIKNSLKSPTPPKLDEAFLLDREEFDSRYPKINHKAGRSWWRIREIYELLVKQSQFLADSKMSNKERYELQAHWLVLAGVLGHYIGDLAQPLHCTENFDGQLTHQKGIHSYFEDKMLNLLLPSLSTEVLKEAKKQWPDFTKKTKDLSTLILISELTQSARFKLRTLLELDKKLKRKNHLQNSKAYRKLIVEQMAEAAVTLAELWHRNLNWKFNGQGFYRFNSTPEYIAPGTSQAKHIEEIHED